MAEKLAQYLRSGRLRLRLEARQYSQMQSRHKLLVRDQREVIFRSQIYRLALNQNTDFDIDLAQAANLSSYQFLQFLQFLQQIYCEQSHQDHQAHQVDIRHYLNHHLSHKYQNYKYQNHEYQRQVQQQVTYLVLIEKWQMSPLRSRGQPVLNYC